MHQLTKYEKILFWLLVIIHLYPVLSVKLFPTLDGPAHLYNANLLAQIITDGNGFASQFFSLKCFPVPNYSGHALLGLLNVFSPAWLAEKILLCLIIISLPLSFRILMKSYDNSLLFVDYLIFPFIYSYTFYLGFFNFSIGVSVMFFTLTYWRKNESNFKPKNIIVLMLLFMLLYFSHLFTFLFTGFIIGFQILWKMILVYLSDKSDTDEVNNNKKNLLRLFMAAIPGLALSVIFLFIKSEETKIIYLETSELVRWIRTVHPIITLNYEMMEPYTKYIFYTFLLLFIYIIFKRAYILFKQKNTVPFYENDSWFFISIILLILYFTIPNWINSGGHISMRVLLFLFLFLLFWIGLQRINKFLIITSALIFVSISFVFLKYHYEQTQFLSEGALEIYNAADYIEPGSVILPVSNSDNWMHANFPGYLAVEKDGIILLDNYEADKPHFALKWKRNKSPYGVIAPDFGSNLNACIDFNKYETISGHSVDYVLRWYYNYESTDSCNIKTNSLVTENYELIYTSPSGRAEVFKKNNKLSN